MPRTADRCKETTTTTGTGTLTLLGAVAQFQAFNTDLPTGSVLTYAIVGQSGTEWEVGRGTLATSSTLTRDQVLGSSNSDALVNLSAGTKDVFATASARDLAAASLGRTMAHATGASRLFEIGK